MNRAVALLLVLSLSSCAIKNALEESTATLVRSAAAAEDGIAGVTSQARVLLVTLDGEVAASGSETRALMVETRASMAEARLLLGTVRAEVAANGSATVELAGSLAGLADTLRDGLAANASSALSTTAAVASTTRELDALLSGLRPNLVAASAELAPTLANVREATKRVSDRADDPLISNESRWLLRIMLGAVAVLLLHAVWTHLHLRKLAGEILATETEPEPDEDET